MMIADMHCDTLYELDRQEKSGLSASLRHNDLMLDLEKMKQSHYLIQNFAVFTNLKVDTDPERHVQELIDLYYRQLAQNRDLIRPVYRYQDIIDHQKQGLMSAMLTLEEGAVIKNDLAYLRHYDRLGVRMITLSWNYPNGLSYPNVHDGLEYHICDEKHGLSDLGREYVREMERLGMIVDVSHMSDRGFYDVLNLTTKPFVASHSNARTVCPHARNMSDEMILALAKRGGVMGINYYARFLKQQASAGMLEDLVKHILYIRNLAGIDVIGLGSDFDGIDCPLEFKDAGGMEMIAAALKEAHLTEDEIDRIFYKNVLRVYEAVLK
ncbi:MAG: dipeptidase [bacterium]